MNGRQFGPGKPGSGDAARQHRAASPKKQERRLNGSQEALQAQYEKAPWEQASPSYPLLKQRCGLSRNFAVLLAAQFRWGWR
jgi:hypothetical protein